MSCPSQLQAVTDSATGAALSSGHDESLSLSDPPASPPRAAQPTQHDEVTQPPPPQQQPAAAQHADAPYLDGGDYLARHHSRGGRHHEKPAAAAPPPAPVPSAPPPAEVVDRLAVVISGLTWWTTDAEVGALVAASEPDSVSFVVDPLNGKSTGKVVVRFPTQSAADACKVGHRLGGSPSDVSNRAPANSPPAVPVGPAGWQGAARQGAAGVVPASQGCARKGPACRG